MAMGQQKPKVVIVTPGTFTVPSDFSSSVERVVDALSEKMKDDLDLYVFSRKTAGYPAYERLKGVTHIRPGTGSRAKYRMSVQRWIHRIRPNLIQVENRPGLVPFFKRMSLRAPVWLSLHSITFLPSSLSPGRVRNAFAAADRIVVNSEFLKEEVVGRYPPCYRKIVVNHLGADENLFASQWNPAVRMQREEFKRNIGFEGKTIVLYAGRLIEIKGVHHLLNVWPDILRHHPNAILLIIGSAYYGSSKMTPYVQRLHQMGNAMPNNVRFLSYIPYHCMPQWFRIADIAAVPSYGKEAFGLVNVEAMASGVPIIASNAGGIKEIVRHGRNGYLVGLDTIESDLRNRFMELLDDAHKRRQFGENGVQRVREQFTWSKAAERQLGLYRRYTHIFDFAGDRARKS